MTIDIRIVNYFDEQHGLALLDLLNSYAMDEMGGGTPLSEHCHNTLIQSLARLDSAISLLAYVDNQAIGLVNAFEGFSTFASAPLINIHDVYIKPEYRGKGVLTPMFERLEDIAIERGCCKLTLEVLSKNIAAQRAYQKAGFCAYTLKGDTGKALFWQKAIPGK